MERLIRNAEDEVVAIRCDCGAKIHNPEGWENCCGKCGALYNGSGQRLRDDWASTYEEQWDDDY